MFDLRLPIGYYFLINAAVLVVYSLLAPSQVEAGGVRLNLNLVWGIVFFVFGAFMAGLGLADRAKEARAKKAAEGAHSADGAHEPGSGDRNAE